MVMRPRFTVQCGCSSRALEILNLQAQVPPDPGLLYSVDIASVTSPAHSKHILIRESVCLIPATRRTEKRAAASAE